MSYDPLFRIYFSLKFKFNYIRFRSRIKRWVNNGMKLGDNVTIMPTARIDDEYPYLITIEDNCSISQNVSILAHDATTFKFTAEHTRLQKVTLHRNVFLGENVIILPGVTIGPDVLVAAGSVVNKDIPPNSCVAGIPARRYQSFDQFVENHNKRIEEDNVVDYMTLNGPNSLEARKHLLRVLEKKGIAYVRSFSGSFPYTISGRNFR